MSNLTAAIDQWYEWTVRIRAKKFELGESFSVLIFLGEVPHDPNQWMSSESFAGVHHVFAGMPDGGGDSDMINEGFIRVNRHLQRRMPDQKTYDPAVVKPFLKQNLNWRTTDVSMHLLLVLAWTMTTWVQTSTHPVEIRSLEVTVVSVLYHKDPRSNFPVAGERLLHNDITFGRPGGATERTTD
jgi:tyrosinase